MNFQINDVYSEMFRDNFLHIGDSSFYVEGNEATQLFIFANKFNKNDLFYDDESKRIEFKIAHLLAGRLIEHTTKNIYSRDHYFPPEIVEKMQNNECFVDIGMYKSDTIKDFLMRTNYQFERIYGFEVDKSIFMDAENYINTLDKPIKEKILLYNFGLSNHSGNVKIVPNGSGTYTITDTGGGGEVDKLDDVVGQNKVTFIKMDIEGTEMEAIEGAERIIVQQRPKLAISCYHRQRNGVYTGSSDLFDIPLKIKSLVPEYKIFLRHHSVDKNCFETVCYAVL
jgi:FkbM family methyltransferase